MSIPDDNRQLWNCGAGSIFEFLCPEAWDKLSLTGSPDMRHCSVCKESVYLCSTPEAFVEFGRSGKCIAILPGSARRKTNGYLGRPSQQLLDEVASARRFWDAVIELGRRAAIEEYFNGVSTQGVSPPKGINYIIIDVGKQTSLAMLIRDCRLDRTQILPFGIFSFHEAIISHLKLSIGGEIGENTAADLLIETLATHRDSEVDSITISWIDCQLGIPRRDSVSCHDVRLAIREYLSALSNVILDMDQGGGRMFIYLTGDDPCIKGIAVELTNLIGMPVSVPSMTADDQVIRGLCKTMDQSDVEGSRLDGGR